MEVRSHFPQIMSRNVVRSVPRTTLRQQDNCHWVT